MIFHPQYTPEQDISTNSPGPLRNNLHSTQTTEFVLPLICTADTREDPYWRHTLIISTPRTIHRRNPHHRKKEQSELQRTNRHVTCTHPNLRTPKLTHRRICATLPTNQVTQSTPVPKHRQSPLFVPKEDIRDRIPQPAVDPPNSRTHPLKPHTAIHS